MFEKNPKTSKRGGKNKTDLTYERIFGQNNVIRKEKSEYVKIWKQLTKEYQNTKPAYRRLKKQNITQKDDIIQNYITQDKLLCLQCYNWTDSLARVMHP